MAREIIAMIISPQLVFLAGVVVASCASDAERRMPEAVRYAKRYWTFILFPKQKEGRLMGGFLLGFYRITCAHQEFPSPPTCLDLPRLA